MKYFYYVYRVDGDKPRIKHETFESAQSEAIRLSRKHKGCLFEILCIKSNVHSQQDKTIITYSNNCHTIGNSQAKKIKAMNTPKTEDETLLNQQPYSLIKRMRDALIRWEETSWDGDPRLRSSDVGCIEACKLIDEANSFLSSNGNY